MALAHWCRTLVALSIPCNGDDTCAMLRLRQWWIIPVVIMMNLCVPLWLCRISVMVNSWHIPVVTMVTLWQWWHIPLCVDNAIATVTHALCDMMLFCALLIFVKHMLVATAWLKCDTTACYDVSDNGDTHTRYDFGDNGDTNACYNVNDNGDTRYDFGDTCQQCCCCLSHSEQALPA